MPDASELSLGARRTIPLRERKDVVVGVQVEASDASVTVPLLGLTLVADLSQVAGSVGELCHELVEYPVERTHGDGGRRARELWTCVWLVDIGHGGQAPQATPRPSVVHPG